MQIPVSFKGLLFFATLLGASAQAADTFIPIDVPGPTTTTAVAHVATGFAGRL